jgi:hypothetical protein
LTVTSGGAVIAAAQVTRDLSGNVTAAPLPGDLPPPVPDVMPGGRLRVSVPPGDPDQVQSVVVAIDTHDSRRDPQILSTSLPLVTELDAGAAGPIGHTFVKDVSIADGHLFKQFDDLDVVGRGLGLHLVRTYTNLARHSGSTPLGDGWTHSYRSWVLETLASRESPHRFVVNGGEGNGYLFTCDAQNACVAQSGLHGTLTVGNGVDDPVVFRSKTGVQYRYGRPIAGTRPLRRPLEAIVDGAGHQVTLEYT